MPYGATIKGEAVYCHSLGLNATANEYAGVYNTILLNWFGDSRGFVVGIHALPQRKYRTLIVRHHDLPGHLNPLLVLNLKRPSKWTPVGQQAVVDELAEHIKGRFDLTQHDTIYGLGAIGLHWVVCKMKSGDDQPTIVVDWQDNIASDASYVRFESVANLIYNIASK
jgi:hypothetical protein